LDQLTAAQEASSEDEASESSPLAGLHFGGEILFEASSGKDYEKREEGELLVSSVDVSIQKNFSKRMDGTISFLYEEGATDFGVDSAFVTNRWGDEHVITASFGLQSLQLGVYDSRFATDSLVLEMTDASDTSAMVTYEWNHLTAGLYGYNGVSKKDEQSDYFHGFGLYAQFENSENKLLGFIERLRFGYLAHAADSALVYEHADNAETEDDEGLRLTESPGVLDAQAKFSLGDFSVIGEYAWMRNKFSDSSELIYDSKGATFKSWQTELAWQFMEKWSAQIGVQGTQEALVLELPKSRYLAGVSWEVNDFMNLNAEYKINKDYGTTDCIDDVTCGSGETERVTTIQAKLVFF
jgi:hypothetical protein